MAYNNKGQLLSPDNKRLVNWHVINRARLLQVTPKLPPLPTTIYRDRDLERTSVTNKSENDRRIFFILFFKIRNWRI